MGGQLIFPCCPTTGSPRRQFPVTLRMCSCSPLTPYILSTNQSFSERNLLPRGICQCCNRERSPCQRSSWQWRSRKYALPWFGREPHCHILWALARGGSNNRRNIYCWFINPWILILFNKQNFQIKIGKGSWGQNGRVTRQIKFPLCILNSPQRL